MLDVLHFNVELFPLSEIPGRHLDVILLVVQVITH